MTIPRLRLTESALRDAAVADALSGLAREVLHDGDPARMWAEWVNANLGDLPLGAHVLGVDVEQGPDYLARLKAAVMVELIVKSKHNG